MKKTITLSLTIVLFLSFSAPFAIAGSKERHRWQGAAMALGAAIIGNAIINSCEYDSTPRPVSASTYRRYEGRHYQSGYHERHRRGQWEYRKVWVDPVHARVWNPGHYNACHRWIPGEYILIEREPGYWKTERVWVGCR